jgi:hypothetical protein
MTKIETFAEKNIRFLNNLKSDFLLPEGVEILVPYRLQSVKEVVRNYYRKYYNDSAGRIFMFGINPGRFGSGITGISFTDPVRLKSVAGIDHPFELKGEISSEFIYRVIERYGGIDAFTGSFFLSAVCPLGFTLNGRNYNYYDDPQLERLVRPFVLKTMKRQLRIGANRDLAICIGEGDNFRYFNELNAENSWFKDVVALPHPRWIMQYRRRELNTFINRYVETLYSVRDKVKIC